MLSTDSERSISISHFLHILLDLSGPVVDAARNSQPEQDVSHGDSKPSQGGQGPPVGKPSQGGHPQKDDLVVNPHEDCESAISEYTGRRHPKPESPHIYHPTRTMRGPARLESAQEDLLATGGDLYSPVSTHQINANIDETRTEFGGDYHSLPNW